MSSLTSLISRKSEAWQDLVLEVLHILVFFLWVQADMGVDGNKEVDLAKKALDHPQLEINIFLSNTEMKRLIAIEINKNWQE